MLVRFAGIGFISFAMIGAAYADPAVDQYRGKAYAQQLCAGCHSIAPDIAKSPNSAAPPFAKVSAADKYTAESFADWLGTAHPVINGVAIKPQVAGDILAYIHSLGPAKQQAANVH
jgi:mono/diheme cytochrome c family protein